MSPQWAQVSQNRTPATATIVTRAAASGHSRSMCVSKFGGVPAPDSDVGEAEVADDSGTIRLPGAAPALTRINSGFVKSDAVPSRHDAQVAIFRGQIICHRERSGVEESARSRVESVSAHQ